MTKQEILDYFSLIDFAYNESGRFESLSRMIDELLKEQEAVKQKTGHWVEQQINSYTRSTTCSVCGGSAPFVFVSADRYGRNGCGKDELTKYCPNCGAEMKGETEVEID